jgi:transcription elongation factor Elf1
MLSADCPECGEFGPLDLDRGEGVHTCESCGCVYEWEIQVLTTVIQEGRAFRPDELVKGGVE